MYNSHKEKALIVHKNAYEKIKFTKYNNIYHIDLKDYEIKKVDFAMMNMEQYTLAH